MTCLNINRGFVRRDIIIGARRTSNFALVILLIILGFGFLLGGLSSFIEYDLLPFGDTSGVPFRPQGLAMIFYSVLSLSLNLLVSLLIYWNIGGGYNEYDKRSRVIRIMRYGFPGKNRYIFFCYSFDNVKSIKVYIRDGINPKRSIYLCIKDEREIPITPVEQPRSLAAIEKEASELAEFLETDLEGL